MEKGELRLHCAACGIQLLSYQDTRTCKRCGITLCSGCYNLKDKFQQIASNDRDKCSGCCTVVTIKKSQRSKKVSLTVPSDNDPHTDSEEKEDKYRTLGKLTITSLDDDEQVLNDKECSRKQLSNSPVQNNSIFLMSDNNRPTETESSDRSHCEADDTIKEICTSVDITIDVNEPRKECDDHYLSPTAFTSLPAENIVAGSQFYTSVSSELKQTSSDPTEQNDEQISHWKDTTKDSETFKNQKLYFPITNKSENELAKYSSLPLNLESAESSESFSSSRNVASKCLTSATKTHLEDLLNKTTGEDSSNLSSADKGLSSQTDEVCINDTTKNNNTISDKNEMKTVICNLEQENNQLPIDPLHEDNENETKKQDQSTEKCRFPQNAIDRKCFKVDLETDSVKEYNGIPENTAVTLEATNSEKDKSKTSVKSARNLNDCFHTTEVLHNVDKDLIATSFEEYLGENDNMNNQHINYDVPGLKEEEGESGNKDVPLLRYLCQAALQTHDLKQETDLKTSEKRSVQFDNLNVSYKCTNENNYSEEGIYMYENKKNQSHFNSETCYAEKEIVENHTRGNKLSKLKGQTIEFKSHIEDTDEQPMTKQSEIDLGLENDNQSKNDSLRARSITGILEKFEINENNKDILPKEIIFVAEQSTIHLYKLVNQSEDTECQNKNEKENGEENVAHSHIAGSTNDQPVTYNDTHKNRQKPQTSYCSVCKTYHATTSIFATKLPAQAFLHSFEGDIVSGLGNSPEDDSNLCDNLLPNQIRYMSLMRQTESSGGNFAFDLDSLMALNPDYLGKMAKEQYSIQNKDGEQREYHEQQSEGKTTIYNNTRSESDKSKPYSSKRELSTQDNTYNDLQQSDILFTDTESTVGDENIPIGGDISVMEENLNGQNNNETKEFEIMRDFGFPLLNESADCFKTQQLKEKKQNPEAQPKHRPTLEDIAEKQNQSKKKVEEEKKQTVLETLNAAIEAGLLPHSTDNSTKKSSSPEKSVLDFFPIMKWTETLMKAKADFDNVKKTNDPQQIVSAYIEYVKKVDDCRTWLSSSEKLLNPKDKGHVHSSEEASVSQQNDTLTHQSQNSKSAGAIKELIELLTIMMSSSTNTDDDNSVFGKDPQESPQQSDAAQSNTLNAMVTTLLSALSSSGTQYEPYLSGHHSPAPSTSQQPSNRAERFKKPFTGRLLKSPRHMDNESRKDLNSPPVKNRVKTNDTKKNKNILPVKTPKKERLFQLGGDWIEDSDKSRSGSLSEISDDSTRSDQFEPNYKSATWQSNPVYNFSSKDAGENLRKMQSASNKGVENDDYCKGDFRDLHHAKAVYNKEISSGLGTQTVSDQPSFARSHQPANLDEQLETVAKAIGTTVFHVPSDGNCMFSAIVDQLKLLGNFKYTTQTLREKSVQYLRDNPIHEDGTPLECFLSSESWETYLCRMAKENTWGDHLMLNGIAELLECRIIIATVTREQTSTNEIEPTHCDPEITVMIGLKGEAHFESLRRIDWEERLIQMAKEPVTRKPRRKPEKKKPQLAFAAMLAEGRHPVKSHSDISEQQTDNSDEEMDLEAINQYTPEWLMSDTYLWDHVSNCSTSHLSYILRLLYTGDYILNREPLHFRYDELQDKSDFGEYYLVGPTFQDAEAYISRSHNRCGHCHQSVQVAACDCSKTHDWDRYFCMKDTIVVSSDFKAPSDRDLVKDESTSPPGYLKLVPVTETSFSNQLVPSKSGKKFLKKLKPIDHKASVQSKYKSSYPKVENKSKTCKSEDVIVFHTDWPQAATEWVDRHRPSGWPDKICIKECIKMGCFVVPAVDPTALATEDHLDAETLWQYSFATAQGYLIRQCLVRDQFQTFRIFKVLLDECMHCPDVLSTETLMQVFLCASEEIPLELWYKNSSTCILFMVEYLQRQIETRYIPNYFISAQNMVNPENVQRLSILADRLKSFRRFPLVYMLTCAEKYFLGKYRVNESVQTTIQDMQVFKKHKNMAIAIKDTFSSLSIKLASIWINNSHQYKLGYSQIVVAYDEWCRGLEYGLDQIPFDSFINQIVSQSLSTYDQWMFVFYTKEKYNVQYRPDIFGYTSCHILKDFIGEAAGRFGNAVIPDCLSAMGFEFLQKFITLLYHHLHFYTDVIPIIDYTIKEYGDQLIELSNEDIERYSSEGSNPNYQIQVKQYDHNRAIFDLYYILFYCCKDSNQIELFLQYLPEAEKVCEKIYEECDYQRLETMCRRLNLSEKVKEIQEKRSQLKEGSYDMNQLD